MLPVLYSFRRCPYAMRARLALVASEQRCELREVLLRAKPSALLAASPKGTVPVLVLPDGRVLEQSLDIMVWALAQKDPQRWMSPQQGDAGAMFGLIQECDEPFKQGLDRYKYPDRFDNVDPLKQRATCENWLVSLEARLAAHPNLFGERPCLADAAIMPFVRQFAHVDRAWFDAQPWPRLQAWLAAWLKSDMFDRIMVRHDAWQSGAGHLFP